MLLVKTRKYFFLPVFLLLLLATVFFFPGNVSAKSFDNATVKNSIPSPNIPPALCISVTASSIYNAAAVASASPPGGVVKFNLTLYVINSCSQVLVDGSAAFQVEASCLAGTPGGGSSGFILPYSLAHGGGVGESWTGIQAFCLHSNGTVSLPSSVSVVFSFYGDLSSGQGANAPQVVRNVFW